MEILEMEADAEACSSLLHNNKQQHVCRCSFNHQNNNTNKHPHTSLAFEKLYIEADDKQETH